MKNNFKFPDSIPGAETVSTAYDRTAKITCALLYAVILADILFFVHLFITDDFKIQLFYITGLFLSGLLICRNYKFLFSRKKVLLKNYAGSSIGNYSVDEITRELEPLVALSTRKKSGPFIYIMQDSLASPQVIDIYFLNFIKTLNAVYIPEYVFSMFTMNEIKCIVEHEMSHFKRLILPINRFIFPVYLLFMFAASLICSVLPPLLAAFCYFTAAMLTCTAHSFLFNFMSQSQEYLSDLNAAEQHGKINMINALLVFEHSEEIITSIYRTLLPVIDKDATLSARNLESMSADIITAIPYSSRRKNIFRNAVKKFLNSAESSRFRVSLNKNECQMESAAISKFLKNLSHESIVEWDKFDILTRNFRVDEKEYSLLIKSLLKSAKTKKYRILLNNTERDVHPNTINRILFLEKNIRTSV